MTIIETAPHQPDRMRTALTLLYHLAMKNHQPQPEKQNEQHPTV